MSSPSPIRQPHARAETVTTDDARQRMRPKTVPRRSLFNMIQVEEKIIDSSGSYEFEAVNQSQLEEAKVPNEVQRQNAKAAAAYFNKKKVEGVFDGPIKYGARVKKDKPSHLLDIPMIGADGNLNCPAFAKIEDSAIKSQENVIPEESSFHTDPSM